MASYVGAPAASFLNRHSIIKLGSSSIGLVSNSNLTGKFRQSWKIRVSNVGGDSYLDLWKKAVTREKKTAEFERIAQNSAKVDGDSDDGEIESPPEVFEKKSSEFEKILDVSSDERDRAQSLQVMDRAAAAIAAARAILKDSLSRQDDLHDDDDDFEAEISTGEEEDIVSQKYIGKENRSVAVPPQTGGVVNAAPGPDFWSWSPPSGSDLSLDNGIDLNLSRQASPPPTPVKPVMEKEKTLDILSIPLESKVQTTHYPPLPPLQSLMEVKADSVVTAEGKQELGTSFSTQSAEAVHALKKGDEAASEGVNPDGSRWWKETGIEQRPDGVVCRWTLTRGVSADKALEWEEKYWEAADEFERKELGSEKSGRDVYGNVWREFWKESMWQEHGLTHMAKTADKWGKNGNGDEWHEKWWEQYDSSGKADKWAHKWCSIDPNTQLEAGHAHVWHERWGETYDGYGGSTKYTDKWAERSEGDGWSKWGDKWDEHFDSNGHGVKQGESWWEGKYGERWNRTWGEGHNGSGWVHKYGKSSSGEHWDTHEQQDTWYERYPHFGFEHCSENSVQLRQVQKPSQWS